MKTNNILSYWLVGTVCIVVIALLILPISMAVLIAILSPISILGIFCIWKQSKNKAQQII